MILQVAKRIANIRFDAELKKNFLTKSSIKKIPGAHFTKARIRNCTTAVSLLY